MSTPDSIPNFEKRPFDVVLWGASGYTGQLTAEHLARVHGCGNLPGAPRWALAGRHGAKLRRLRERLVGIDPNAGDLPMILADSHDAASLDALCRQTRAVCATVGPFAVHGAELVAACVRQHTHYCDITGEAVFIRRMIDAHHGAAREVGVRIVHCCGIDSVPSDLGVLLLHDHARQMDLGPVAEVRCFVTRFKGGLSVGRCGGARRLLTTSRFRCDSKVIAPLGGGRQRRPEGSEDLGLGWDVHLPS